MKFRKTGMILLILILAANAMTGLIAAGGTAVHAEGAAGDISVFDSVYAKDAADVAPVNTLTFVKAVTDIPADAGTDDAGAPTAGTAYYERIGASRAGFSKQNLGIEIPAGTTTGTLDAWVWIEDKTKVGTFVIRLFTNNIGFNGPSLIEAPQWQWNSAIDMDDAAAGNQRLHNGWNHIRKSVTGLGPTVQAVTVHEHSMDAAKNYDYAVASVTLTPAGGTAASLIDVSAPKSPTDVSSISVVHSIKDVGTLTGGDEGAPAAGTAYYAELANSRGGMAWQNLNLDVSNVNDMGRSDREDYMLDAWVWISDATRTGNLVIRFYPDNLAPAGAGGGSLIEGWTWQLTSAADLNDTLDGTQSYRTGWNHIRKNIRNLSRDSGKATNPTIIKAVTIHEHTPSLAQKYDFAVASLELVKISDESWPLTSLDDAMDVLNIDRYYYNTHNGTNVVTNAAMLGTGQDGSAGGAVWFHNIPLRAGWIAQYGTQENTILTSATSAAEITFWVYVSDKSAISYAAFELGSTPVLDQSEKEWNFTDQLLRDGWNLIKLDFSGGAGGLNLNDIKRYRVFLLSSKTSGTVDIALDSIRMAEPVTEDTSMYGYPVNLMIGADESKRGVVWYSDSSAIGKVQVALKSDRTGSGFPAQYQEFYGSSSRPSAAGKRANKVSITGLAPNREYVYRAGNGNQWSDIYEFATSDFTRSSFSFLFAGDPQIGSSGSIAQDYSGWDTTLNKATTWFPDAKFILSPGDQVEHSNHEGEFAAFLAPDALRSLALAVSLGNHESGSEKYREHFALPNAVAGDADSGVGNYWFTYNGALFMMLNANNANTIEHQTFMKEAVQAYRNQHGGEGPAWKIVTFHHSLYSRTLHTADERIQKQRAELPIVFRNLGVDVVLMGHAHAYTRSKMMNGTEPISTGYTTVTSNVYATYTDDPVINETLYVTGNSSSGSKFYALEDFNFPYIAAENQENSPNITRIEVSANSMTFKTYRTGAESAPGDIVDSFTLYRNADETQPPLGTEDWAPDEAHSYEGSDFFAFTANDGKSGGDLTQTNPAATAEVAIVNVAGLSGSVEGAPTSGTAYRVKLPQGGAKSGVAIENLNWDVSHLQDANRPEGTPYQLEMWFWVEDASKANLPVVRLFRNNLTNTSGSYIEHWSYQWNNAQDMNDLLPGMQTVQTGWNHLVKNIGTIQTDSQYSPPATLNAIVLEDHAGAHAEYAVALASVSLINTAVGPNDDAAKQFADGFESIDLEKYAFEPAVALDADAREGQYAVKFVSANANAGDRVMSYSSRPKKLNFAIADWENTDVRFWAYINNPDLISRAVFELSSAGQGSTDLFEYAFTNQLVSSGWNEVVIPLQSFDPHGLDLEHIQHSRIYMTGSGNGSEAVVKLDDLRLIDTGDAGYEPAVEGSPIFDNGLQAPEVRTNRYDSSDAFIATVDVTRAPYNADNTGSQDVTNIIQRAIDNVQGAYGGGIVFLPKGTYKISDTLNVKAHVTVKGEYNDPDGAAGEYGTIISVNTAKAAFRLTSTAGVSGATIFYPAQNLASPVKSDYTFLNKGGNFTLENITMLNSYRGIGVNVDGGSHGVVRLYNVRGTVLNQGIKMKDGGEVSAINGVAFTPAYWANAAPEYNAPTEAAIRQWMSVRSDSGLEAAGLEGPAFANLTFDGFRTGILSSHGPRVETYAQFYNVNVKNADIAVDLPFAYWDMGIELANCVLEGSGYAIRNLSGEAAKLFNCTLIGATAGGQIVDTSSDIEAAVPEAVILRPSSHDLFNAMDYGADNSGNTDASAAIQQALNAARNNGGGYVYLPGGVYRLDHPITVYGHTELSGSNASIGSDRGFSDVGTTILAYYGAGNTGEDQALVTLANDGAGVTGIRFYYPNNGVVNDGTIDNDVAPYSYTIRGIGDNVYARNLNFYAAYYGIEMDGASNYVIKDVLGSFYKNAIHIKDSLGGIIEGALSNNGQQMSFSAFENWSDFDNWLNTDKNATLEDFYNYVIYGVGQAMHDYLIFDQSVNQTVVNTFAYIPRIFLTANDSEIVGVNLYGSRMGETRSLFKLDGGRTLAVNNFLKVAQVADLTPTTAAGIYNVKGQALPGGVVEDNVEQNLPPLVPIITTASPPNTRVGRAYDFRLEALGDKTMTWTLAGGVLPTGLTLSAAGRISGSPTASGTFSFVVRASNGAGEDERAMSITVGS